MDALGYFNRYEEAATLYQEHERDKLIREKFNGNLVMKWTDHKYSGGRLGCLMSHLRLNLSKEQLLEMTPNAVQQETLRLTKLLEVSVSTRLVK